jgi:anti-sigma-K factor RskA
MTCERIDDLAAAYGLGAVDPDEERGISEHLVSCDRPHVEARDIIGVSTAVPAALEPVAPSAELRARLMATIAATPQEHAAPALPQPVPEPARPWWRLAPLPTALAAVALAAAVGLGAWSLDLNRQLAERDEAIRMVAAADAAYAVSGSAGSGWVLEADGQAIFLADELAELPPDRIYELWLIGPGGDPVAVGVIADTDGVAVAPLERAIGNATTFAVTVERGRVDAPTGDPVLVAPLEG